MPQRQKFIDQSQSLNLFFSANVDPAWFNYVHMEAWRMGVKTLYYCRSSSVLKADSATRTVEEQQQQMKKMKEECGACEG